MSISAIERAAAEAVLELVDADDLSRAAAASLEAGADSPSLRLLAGALGADSPEARALLAGALHELELRAPTKREAVRILARDAAAEVIDGALTPYEGAQRIWDLALRAPEVHLPELDTFVYAASEWDGRPEDAPVFAEGVVAAARDLVNQ